MLVPRLTNYAGYSVPVDFDAGRFVRPQGNGRASSVVGRSNLNSATKDVSPASAGLIDLDAKLGAQIGDDGGGGANGE
jgi:hypothetical protein